MADPVDIRCPGCGRWLAEASEYGRAVCPKCGWEVEVRSKEWRRLRPAVGAQFSRVMPK